MQTCAANGIDGCRYLKALLIALRRATSIDDYEALLPRRIQLSARAGRVLRKDVVDRPLTLRGRSDEEHIAKGLLLKPAVGVSPRRVRKYLPEPPPSQPRALGDG
jgi:hypothetical protein